MEVFIAYIITLALSNTITFNIARYNYEEIRDKNVKRVVELCKDQIKREDVTNIDLVNECRVIVKRLK